MKKIFISLAVILLSMVIINYANALCVSVPKANLRSGPSTDYEVIWEIYKYMPLLKVGISLSGDWYAVRDVDGDVNWIYKKSVTDKYHCAVVKTEQVNVRKGPGTNYSESFISPAKQYYSFKVLQRKGAWVQVKDLGENIGWIHRNYLWIQ